MVWMSSLLPDNAPPPPAAPATMDAPPAGPQAQPAFLLDVRSFAEFMSGHLPGAHCLPLPQLEARMRELCPDLAREIVVYCSSGARAELALATLRRLGYDRARYGGAARELAHSLHVTLIPGM